jgi:hypothetical protein
MLKVKGSSQDNTFSIGSFSIIEVTLLIKAFTSNVDNYHISVTESYDPLEKLIHSRGANKQPKLRQQLSSNSNFTLET